MCEIYGKKKKQTRRRIISLRIKEVSGRSFVIRAN